MELPTNQYHLTFNIPIAYWPDWANYATIGGDYQTKFWQNKPKWSGGRWTVTGGKKCTWGYTPAVYITDFSRCIWDRSKS